MPYPTDCHPRDTRSLEERQENLVNLNIIQDVLEESIGSYAIQNPENIYDEEYQQVLRILEFSRGVYVCQIAIAPDGYIRYLSRKFPCSLLQEIHNALVGLDVFDDPNEVLE